MENYETLSQAINGLKNQGYTEDFNLKAFCLECRGGEFKVLHDEFQIDKVYRFEGDTDPGDQSILFAISSEKFDLKGVLVNGYGIYSDPITDEMQAKLNYDPDK